MRETFRGLILLLCAAAIVACSAGSAPNFTLRDDRGRPWTLSQQRGKALLLTFGFTHCTDTCPATLAKLSRLTASLQQRSQDVEIVFVTVDPVRDTVPVLRRFMARFDPPGEGRLVGLTGTSQDVERVKTAYHIWSQRTPHDIAHTSAIFLIDPQGRISAVRDDSDSQESLAHAVGQMLPAS